ncbi:MAG: hypothetical protein QXF56_00960 [Candidatus Micrarchaeia archaeon]
MFKKKKKAGGDYYISIATDGLVVEVSSPSARYSKRVSEGILRKIQKNKENNTSYL